MYWDLEVFLRNHAGLVLVNLWEQDCQASSSMDQLMHELEHSERIPVLRLALQEYRDWAQAHGIHGTPALVAYYRGRPVFRLIGRVTSAELFQRLRDYRQ